MNDERERDMHAEIADANNRAIAEVQRKFPGGPVGQIRANGEQDVVRINGNLLWPPDRDTVTEQDVRHAWFAHLVAFDAWRSTYTNESYVKVQAAGEALLWTLRYYAQDCHALGYALAKVKYEVKPPSQEKAA